MGATVTLDKWPVLGRHERAAVWLRVWTDLGRAPRTIDAYARGLAEYLEMCERVGVDPLAVDRAHIARFVRELTERPSRRGANVVSIDSGAGLSNATLQQRLCRCGCFTISWSRRACATPTPSDGAVTPPAALAAATSVA